MLTAIAAAPGAVTRAAGAERESVSADTTIACEAGRNCETLPWPLACCSGDQLPADKPRHASVYL